MFHRKCKMIVVCANRFSNTAYTYYDQNWNALKISKSFNIGEEIEKPKFLKKALLIAEKLSEDFDFARIDLYIIGNRIYFGEITHYPLSGLKKITPTEFDFELGKYWKIKK